MTQRAANNELAATPPSRRDRLALHAVAATVTLAVLAPLLRPGYALRYDLVFVPWQPLRWDLVAPSNGLPRAVPQDLIVSLLNLAIPGWALQRVALAGALYAAAYGAGRLVPAAGLLPRVVAAVGYAWAPFLAERLLLGQWGLLLGYAALPWLVAAARGVRAGRPGALAGLLVAAGISAITPTGGLVAAAITAAMTVRRDRIRSMVPTGLVIVLNAPWLTAAAVATASARSDPDGVAAFAVRAENWSGPLGAVAGTGGIWNAQTTPASRASVVVPVVTAVLLALAIWGWRELWRRWGADATRLFAAAGVGVGVALAGTVPFVSTGLGWMVGNVPGAGIIRDGHKFLMPYALLFALGLALGAQRLSRRLAAPRGRLVLVAAAVLPVAVMPDLAWGGAGALHPVRYPADWAAVADLVAQRPGEVLALPFSEYRSYAWNGGETVIDPAPRYLPADVLADDTLYVGAIKVDGESVRAAQVRRLLDEGESVAGVGTTWVLVDRAAAQVTPPSAVAGLTPIFLGTDLDLYANPQAGPEPGTPDGIVIRRLFAGIANVAAATLFLAAIWRLRRLSTRW